MHHFRTISFSKYCAEVSSGKMDHMSENLAGKPSAVLLCPAFTLT